MRALHSMRGAEDRYVCVGRSRRERGRLRFLRRLVQRCFSAAGSFLAHPSSLHCQLQGLPWTRRYKQRQFSHSPTWSGFILCLGWVLQSLRRLEAGSSFSSSAVLWSLRSLGSYLRLGYTRYWCFHLVPPRLGTAFDVSAGVCRFTCAAFRVALCHWPCCDAKYEKHNRFQQQDISVCVMCKHID